MRPLPIVPLASLAVMWLVLSPSPLAAVEPDAFPYEAIVTSENAPVHSGNGEEFYETTRLGKGTRVEVHRHDPDGWRMIRPPEEAFSLIPAESVRSLDGNFSQIVADEVCARVGSTLAEDFNVEQVPLRIGTRVELLSQHDAPEGWIAIRPPRGEYRWILAEHLERIESKPIRSAEKAINNTMTLQSDDSPANSDDPNNLFDSLAELDRQLEGLDDENPANWPLEALSVGYLRIKRSQLDLAREIDARLARIAELKLIRDDYLGIADTASREKTSVAATMEPEVPPANEVATAENSTRRTYRPPSEVTEYYPTSIGALPRDRGAGAPITKPTPMADDGGPDLPTPSVPPPQSSPSTAIPTPATSLAASPPPPIPATGKKAPQRFDAVGYIQKAVNPSPGAPRYILVSREGQIVAYLRVPGTTSIESYIGYPMGVDGAPQQLPNLKLPLITIERLTPVRF